MENENKSPYLFLEYEDVQRSFADLNISLLEGRHIQISDSRIFHLLESYPEELKHYYESLYGLELTHDKYDNESYYYLNFPLDSKGKLSESSRYKLLSDQNTIIGIMLLNIYHEKFFDKEKEVTWDDLVKIITEGENSNLYRKLWFNDIRDNYDHLDWKKKFYDKISNTLKEFQKLGWITGVFPQKSGTEIAQIQEGLRFQINVSINRFAKLYEHEIHHFDKFVETYHKNHVERL